MITLHTFSGVAAGSSEPRDSVQSQLAEVAARGLSYAGASGVWIASLDGDSLVVRATAGAAVEANTRIPLDGGLADICIQSGRIVRSDDLDIDRRAAASTYRALEAKSAIMVPVKCSGKVRGLLAGLAPTTNGFTRTHVAVLLTLADVIAEVFSRELPLNAVNPPAAQQTPPLPVADPLPSEPPATAEHKPSWQSAELRPGLPMAARQVGNTTFSSGTLHLGQASTSSRLIGNRPPENNPLAEPPLMTTLADSIERDKTGEARRVETRSDAAPKLGTQSRYSQQSFASSTPDYPSVVPNFLGSYSMDTRDRRSFKPWIVVPASLLLIATGSIWAFRILGSEVDPPRIEWSAPKAPELTPVSVPTSELSERVPIPQPVPVAKALTKKEAAASPAPKQKAVETGFDQRHLDAVQVRSFVPAIKPQEQNPVDAPTLAASTTAVAPLPEIPQLKPSAPTPRFEVNPAVLVGRVQPVYPMIARAGKLQGTVQLELTIDESGSVASATVVSGRAEFHQAALTAVRQWRYQPATMGGKPVKSSSRVLIDFRQP